MEHVLLSAFTASKAEKKRDKVSQVSQTLIAAVSEDKVHLGFTFTPENDTLSAVRTIAAHEYLHL